MKRLSILTAKMTGFLEAAIEVCLANSCSE